MPIILGRNFNASSGSPSGSIPTTDLYYNLDASTITNKSDGDFVNQGDWVDQSPNNYPTLIENNNELQYRPTGLNGFPSIEFNNSRVWMNTTGGSGFVSSDTLNAPIIVSVVVYKRPNNVNPNHEFISSFGSGLYEDIAIKDLNNAVEFKTGNSGSYFTRQISVPDDEVFVFTNFHDQSGNYIFKGNQSYQRTGSNATVTGGVNKLAFGGVYYAPYGWYWQGLISEVAVYTGANVDGNLANQVHNSLGSRWGIF